jgi:hypothetical protein
MHKVKSVLYKNYLTEIKIRVMIQSKDLRLDSSINFSNENTWSLKTKNMLTI